MVGSMAKLAEENAEERGGVTTGGSTWIFAVDAFVGTTAIMEVLPMLLKLRALALPNITPAAAVKFVPVIVTFVPGRPVEGDMPVITGAT
jgi:hypothetical protein